MCNHGYFTYCSTIQWLLVYYPSEGRLAEHITSTCQTFYGWIKAFIFFNIFFCCWNFIIFQFLTKPTWNFYSKFMFLWAKHNYQRVTFINKMSLGVDLDLKLLRNKKNTWAFLIIIQQTKVQSYMPSTSNFSNYDISLTAMIAIAIKKMNHEG